MTTIVENQERETQVKEGIDFLLSHFEGRQKLFPRKMSTFTSQGKQFIVYNKEQILDICIKSNFKDCRLNAYPVLENGLLQAPNLIFIDLDLPTKYEDNLKEIDKTLDKTLRLIKQKLNGCRATVLRTGNGYHIYIVLDIRPLELINEVKELSDKPSEQFLRFAESVFTNNKKDSQHNPSFKSCLLRIPGTSNSKNGSEVKIIQSFDANNIPSIDNTIMREFRLYLADIDIRKKEISETNEKRCNNFKATQYNSIMRYNWIEKLLQTHIEDGRKYALWKILCPYLVNIKKLQDVQSYKILKIWLENCNNLRNLDFNPDTEIKAKLKNVKYYNPISIKNLIINNKKLYLLLRQKL
jgi:Primase X